MKTTFYELPLGARFEFRGRRFVKVGLSMAEDEERWGTVFHDDTEVAWDPRPGEELRPRRAPEPYWADHIEPAPGESLRA